MKIYIDRQLSALSEHEFSSIQMDSKQIYCVRRRHNSKTIDTLESEKEIVRRIKLLKVKIGSFRKKSEM